MTAITAYTLTLEHPIEADSPDAAGFLYLSSMIRGVADVTPALPMPGSVWRALSAALDLYITEYGIEGHREVRAWLQTQKPKQPVDISRATV